MSTGNSKNPENQDLLTDEQLKSVIRIIVQGFDIELARIIDEKSQLKIVDNYIRLYHDSSYFTFFTLQNLKTLSLALFTDEIQRSFILNLTDRVSMGMITKELNYDERFLTSIVRGICNSKKEFSELKLSLMNEEVATAISVNPDMIRLVLIDNMWLTVIYLLLINFQQSSFFQTFTEKTSEVKR